jgi:hypothetical protein
LQSLAPKGEVQALPYCHEALVKIVRDVFTMASFVQNLPKMNPLTQREYVCSSHFISSLLYYIGIHFGHCSNPTYENFDFLGHQNICSIEGMITCH